MSSTENPKNQNPYHVYYDNYLDTDACTECTGLMHRAAVDRQEWEAYLEVCNFTTQPPDAREKQQEPPSR